MKIYFCGIGGVGMSNLARLAVLSGCEVSGSDRRPLVETPEFLACGMLRIYSEQTAANVSDADADIVVRSVAIPDDNPEIVCARKLGIPIWSRTQCLAWLLRNKNIIAVSGSFGKSSTTALLADTLANVGWDPAIYVGAKMASLGSGAHWGLGSHAVIEACEYKREILHVIPQHLLITNLAVNHEDEFGEDLECLLRMFESYLRINEDMIQSIWVGEDDAGSLQLLKRGFPRVQTYGLPHSDWFAAGQYMPDRKGMRFELFHRGTPSGVYFTNWLGSHVVRNLTPVLGLLKTLGLPDEAIAHSLSASRNLPRRFETLFSKENFVVVDDNARLPNQVMATTSAARSLAGEVGRLIVVLGIWGKLNRRNLEAYVAALKGSDRVYVLPSRDYEIDAGGLEPLNADLKFIQLMRDAGIDARRFESAEGLEVMRGGAESTYLITMGYENFGPIFRDIHRYYIKMLE